MYHRHQTQQMPSPGERHGHFYVVARHEALHCCHCANEWYRDGNGPVCPNCHREIPETTYSGDDIRHHSSVSTYPWLSARGFDPGEADINNQGGENGTGGGLPSSLGQGLQDLTDPLSQWVATVSATVNSLEVHGIRPGLTEAHFLSNAAPLASGEALQNLTRRVVDKQTLGSESKALCTICVDEMKEVNMAISLPCNHWYHEECAIPWLKEHNTCPICRTLIEQSDQSGDSRNNDDSSPS